jgi:outer membrane protein TolC
LAKRLLLTLMIVAGTTPGLLAVAAPYDPAAPVPGMTYDAVSSQSSATTAMGETDWHSANDTVGAFTRGHIDVLKWEAENLSTETRETVSDGTPLSPAEAVRVALANRPDLYATTDMSALERARADVAAVSFARDVQRAWVAAVAADQSLRLAYDAFEATEAGTELGVRMTRVGNWGQDRLVREQLALTDAGIRLAQARQRAASARELLVRLMGLWGEAAQIALPSELPALPDRPLPGDGLEAVALRTHPQLEVAAIEAERARRGIASRSLERWSELTREALSQSVGSPPDDGNPLAQTISSAPVIDLRRSAVDHETVRAVRVQADATALAVAIRSNVREAYLQYRIAHDVAQSARENARLSTEMQEEMLMRYNGMLNSTWDLLASGRDRVASEAAALQAQRDFWLAHANLQAVLAGADYTGPDPIGGKAGENKQKGH